MDYKTCQCSLHVTCDFIHTQIECRNQFFFIFLFSVLQVAAVIGIGLVYQGTGHRHNAEVLLSEIGVYVCCTSSPKCLFFKPFNLSEL